MEQSSYDYCPSRNDAAMVLGKSLLIFHRCVLLLKHRACWNFTEKEFSTGREKRAQGWKFNFNSAGVPVVESFFIRRVPAISTRTQSDEHNLLKQTGR